MSSIEKEFNVILCGGKGLTDYNFLKNTCDHLLSRRIEKKEKITLYLGGSKSLDELGKKYAADNNFDCKVVPIIWNERYGNRAGYLRNSKLADVGHACIAFIDGSIDRGTSMMTRIARDRHLLVREIYFTLKTNNKDE